MVGMMLGTTKGARMSLQDELDQLNKEFENHQCSYETRAFDAYCPCKGAAEIAGRLWTNIHHPHGAGLDPDDYRREELITYDQPSKYEWEKLLEQAAWDAQDCPF